MLGRGRRPARRPVMGHHGGAVASIRRLLLKIRQDGYLGRLAVLVSRKYDCLGPGLAPQPLPQQLLALLGALAALRLRLAEERGQLGVALTFGVLDVGL
jgi:hypothetical protein